MSGERIRVELVRTGGFGGLRLHSTLDSAELPDAEARELATLAEAAETAVREAGLPEAGTREPGPGGGARPVPDAFRYRLSVRRAGRRWDGEFEEGQVPARLRPLLDLLVERARHGS